jgi:hypothetical protein
LPEWAGSAAISVPGVARGGADVTFVAGGAHLAVVSERGAAPDAATSAGMTAER